MSQKFRIVLTNTVGTTAYTTYGQSILEFAVLGSRVSNEIYGYLAAGYYKVSTVGEYSEAALTAFRVPTVQYTIGFKVKYEYLVNVSKNEFIDMKRYSDLNADVSGKILDPLFLLTAVGNGHCNDEYDGPDLDLVGSWAGDYIRAVDSIEIKEWKGASEICPRFEV